MQKNYELLYIVHPDLEGSTDKVTEKVAGFIKKAGGEVTNQEDWGKKKLAYKIAKNDFGVYVLVNFSVESVKLANIERDIRLSEEIMRSLIVSMPEISEVKKSAKAQKAAPKSEEKAEEPANIIVADEGKKAKVKSKKTEEAESIEAVEAAPKKPATKKAPAKKAAKTEEVDEKERLKKLDEKLDELLK